MAQEPSTLAESGFHGVVSQDAFHGPPARRFFLGRCFLFWQDEARAFGTIVWGAPRTADVDTMCSLFELGADPRFRGHASLVDARALESIDLLGFERLQAFLARQRMAWADNVGRQAVLHGDGYAAAVLIGLFGLLAPAYPMKFFSAPEAAFDWVGVSDLFDSVENLRLASIGERSLPFRVRSVLRARSVPAKLEAVARTLGLSVRSLQRGLEESDTSFREERLAFILSEAARLLEGTDLSVDAIAAQLGVRSASHLSESFRRKHGVSPSEWRLGKHTFSRSPSR